MGCLQGGSQPKIRKQVHDASLGRDSAMDGRDSIINGRNSGRSSRIEGHGETVEGRDTDAPGAERDETRSIGRTDSRLRPSVVHLKP